MTWRLQGLSWNVACELLAGVLLAALAVVLLLRGLGAASFHDSDEALYAQVALEMEAAGEWLTPLYWGEPFLHKPPLGYWLALLAHRCLPQSPPELYARLPSAVAALLLVGLVYWTTRRLAGAVAAAGAALALLGNGQLLYEHGARSANLDAPLTLLCFAALVFGACAHQRTSDRILSAVALGGAGLLKAPIALFVFLAVLADQLVRNRRSALRWLAWVAGAVLVVVVPWHVHQLWTHGRRFWDTYVVFEILGRTGATASFYSTRPLVHIEALWASFLPWSPLLLLANLAALCWWPGRAGDGPGRARDVCRLFAAFSLAYCVVLCAIPAKWPWYALVVYPAMVVVASTLLAELARGPRSALVPPVLALAAAARVALLDPVADYAPAARSSYLWPGATAMLQRVDQAVSMEEVLAAALLVATGSLVLIPAYRRSRRKTAGLTAVLAAVILALGIRTVAAVPVRAVSPAHKLAQRLAQQQVDNVILLGFSHEERYGGRMEPLSSVYLHDVAGAVVTDCRQDLACAAVARAGASALVIHDLGFRALASDQRLKELATRPDLELWLLSERGAQRLRPGAQ